MRRKYKQYNAVSAKMRNMANRGIKPIEGVVTESNSDNTEKLYFEFVAWAQYKNINPNQFRYIYKRYYDEFIGGL